VRIVLAGTRGPGFYGGFETCVAELAPRLAGRGHEVTAYARRWSPASQWRHEGVRVEVLPSVHTKSLDTVSHSALTTGHILRHRPDVTVFFGVGNSPFVRFLRRMGVATVLNVDGLDRTRRKWGRSGRGYLTLAERMSAGGADVVITDALAVQRYYRETYATETTFIPYGAPDGPVGTTAEVESAGLQPGHYILYVSRLEPENNCETVLEAYGSANPGLPLVVVGGSRYDPGYEEELKRKAPPGVVFLGFVYGQGYVELQSHATLYVQSTEVGGTHPALVEAMAYGNAVIALDTPEHREVLGGAGLYYRTARELAALMSQLATDAGRREEMATLARQQAARYSWDSVTTGYEEACRKALAAARRRRR